MGMKLKVLLMEILVEALFGKRFPVQIKKNGETFVKAGIASANAKPNERPYRITWFSQDFSENRHVDLTLEEVMAILHEKSFPPDIVQRVKDRYPGDDSDFIGDQYTILYTAD